MILKSKFLGISRYFDGNRAQNNMRFLTFNCRTETLECGGCGGLDTMGQTAIAVAIGAAGEFQRGWCDAGHPHRGGILPESSPGEREYNYYTLS